MHISFSLLEQGSEIESETQPSANQGKTVIAESGLPDVVQSKYSEKTPNSSFSSFIPAMALEDPY